MLEVVEYKQQLAIAEESDQNILQRHRPGFLQPQSPHDRRSDELCIEDGRNSTKQMPSLKREIAATRRRWPSVSSRCRGPLRVIRPEWGPGRRSRSSATSFSRPSRDVRGTGRLKRTSVECPQRWELRAHAGGDDLVDLLRPWEVTELVLADGAEIHILGQEFGNEGLRRLGDEHLAAVTDLHSRAARWTSRPPASSSGDAIGVLKRPV